MSIHEVVVPDIGDSRDVEVAELLVAVGATVAANDALMVLESDKASVEVTTTVAGVVRELAVQAGDKVAEAQVLARIETAGAAVSPEAVTASAPAAVTVSAAATVVAAPAANVAAPAASIMPPTVPPTVPSTGEVAAAPPAAAAQSVDVVVPDLGDAKNVVVSEILVTIGATVKKGQALIVLESDKASMEIEAAADGVVTKIGVAADQEVVQGTLVAVLSVAAGGAVAPTPVRTSASVPVAIPPPSAVVGATSDTDSTSVTQAAARAAAPVAQTVVAVVALAAAPAATSAARPAAAPGTAVYAGPAVRKAARELGVDLAAVSATGARGRVVKDDINRYVKQRLSAPAPSPSAATTANTGIAPVPTIDFSRFGPIEEQKLPRIQRVGGVNLHRSWLNVPHVTHFDEADITDLEVFRKSLKDEAQRAGARVTPLAFLLKACARVLADFPKFNSSLGPNKDTLIYKRYFNLGVAVDTEEGLVVPVVKSVEQKGIFQLAKEVADLSERARIGKLKPDEMSGGTFSISSLGILGGVGFTPIINAPEVAILGVAKLATKPVWNGKAFEPREMLPLSLSYDHRVVNGADAARFTTALMATLADMRRTLL